MLYGGMAMSYLHDLERLQAQLGSFVSENPEYGLKRRHLLFVYGTMKRGLRNHGRLAKAKFVDHATTVGNCYLMSTKKMAGGHLAPVVNLNGLFQVRGELYEVDGPTLAEIDLCEGHPLTYERLDVMVNVDHDGGGPLRVWMYLFGAHPEEKVTCTGVRVDGMVMEFRP